MYENFFKFNQMFLSRGRQNVKTTIKKLFIDQSEVSALPVGSTGSKLYFVNTHRRTWYVHAHSIHINLIRKNTCLKVCFTKYISVEIHVNQLSISLSLRKQYHCCEIRYASSFFYSQFIKEIFIHKTTMNYIPPIHLSYRSISQMEILVAKQILFTLYLGYVCSMYNELFI